jgi:1-acyl-sn-glycerol-3-phosphate acyltransferase
MGFYRSAGEPGKQEQPENTLVGEDRRTAAVPRTPRARAFLAALSRLVLKIFFRRVEVIGASRLATGGPRIVVGNHVNGLVDPLFFLGTLRLPVRLLGKSTLWRIPVLAQLMDLAGVIPVFRRQDRGFDAAGNLSAFAACHEILRRGGTVGLFPEGKSHDEPQLQPLKTGVARIAIDAEQEYGPLGLRIVPVGLFFDERGTFRSRALVVVGEPLDPSPEIARAATDEPRAIRELTERVADALEAITLNFASWDEARWIERGADVVLTDPRTGSRARRLATEFVTRQRMAEGYARLVRERPAEVHAAIETIRRYERMLEAADLEDRQVVTRVDVAGALAFLGRVITRLTVLWPTAVLGLLVNGPPFAVVHAIASRFRGEPNQLATYKIFPGLLLYPAAWAAAGWLVSRAAGWPWGVAAFLLSPVCGWLAIRFGERLELLWSEGRAFLLLRLRRGFAAELRRRRDKVAEEIERLAALLNADSADSQSLSASGSAPSGAPGSRA